MYIASIAGIIKFQC